MQPETRPALWNPNAAACWSLIFSPAFGAYLHAQNADSLGRSDEASANRAWFYASLGYLVFVLFSVFFPQIPDAVFRGAAIGILLGWYFSLGKKQVQYVKEISYTRKPWTKPLLIASACFVGFVVLVVAVVIIADAFFGFEWI